MTSNVTPAPSATIYEVAARAGVSIATVSRTFADNGSVAPRTREAVLTAAQELRADALAGEYGDKVQGFDDVVIFVHDVERSLALLDHEETALIRRIAVQEYTHAETAEMLRLPTRTVTRRYDKALDVLTRIFLDRRLLVPFVSCQGVENQK